MTQRFLRGGDSMGFSEGNWGAQVGSKSTPCANGGISWATARGRDEVSGDRNGSWGSMRWVRWGCHWRNRSAREGGTR